MGEQAVPLAIPIAAGGAFLFALLLFQVSLGMRWIKFKGRRHWAVHKAVAWTIVGFAGLHGVGALMYLGILPGL